MKARKTIEVNYLKELINKELCKTEFCLNTDQKDVLTSLIEIILHKTGNYKGFMFKDNNDTEFLSNGYFSRKYF